MLKNGEMFTLTTRDILGDAHDCGITYANLPQELKAGDAVLIDDGKLRLEVCETTDTDILLQNHQRRADQQSQGNQRPLRGAADGIPQRAGQA